MNLARHYRTLGLRRGASFSEVKLTYRQLVRRYHPDVNPDEQAIDHFIKINHAYTAIADTLQPTSDSSKNAPPPLHAERFNLDSFKAQLEKLGIGSFTAPSIDPQTATEQPTDEQPTSEGSARQTTVKARFDSAVIAAESHLPAGSETYRTPTKEESLKQDAYLQLKELLKQQKFPRAIALVEGLAHRMPADSEISQWQAIVYQRWGRLLINQGQPQKARIYLKKALRTDPNNQSLWSEVNRDFWQLANLASQSSPAV